MTPGAGDKATVSVLVAVPPADAFAIFTTEIDLWWRQGPKFRIGMWWSELMTSLREHAATR